MTQLGAFIDLVVSAQDVFDELEVTHSGCNIAGDACVLDLGHAHRKIRNLRDALERARSTIGGDA
jgi:hypothetical protein